MDHSCTYCESPMQIEEIGCPDCGLTIGGGIETPRLLQLSKADRDFIECFVLASGSLKQMASLFELSYPTIRGRLDKLIERLEGLKKQSDLRREKILQDIESGKITARHGMRLIDNL